MPGITAAIIGTAHPHSPAYQQTLAAAPEIEIVAVMGDGGNIHPDLAATPHCQSMPAMLNTVVPQAAFVLLPDDQSGAVCSLLAAKGIHIFCEKPGARTAAEMAELSAVVQKAGIHFCIGYQWRVHPLARQIREWMANGLLGDIVTVEARLLTTTVAARNHQHYLFQKARSGGGIVHWLGCHHIDLLRYLLDQEVAEVAAFTATTSPAIDVEDVAVVTLRFTTGTLGSLHQGYLLPGTPDNPFMKSRYDMYIALHGTRGWVRWDPTTPTLAVYSTDERWRGAPYRQVNAEMTELPGYGWMGQEMVQRFAASVTEGRPTVAGVSDALRVLQVIDAVYQAAATRQTINLTGIL